MTYTTPIGVDVIESYPWNEVYYDDDLATGANDGTSEANAWQSVAAMIAGVKSSDRVNMKKTGSAVTLTANLFFPAGDEAGYIEYRGYGTTIGDGIRWEGDASTFTFVGSQGPQIFSYLDLIGQSSQFVMQMNGRQNSVLHNCSFVNTGTNGGGLWTEACLMISCTMTGSSAGGGSAEGFWGWGVLIDCILDGSNASLDVSTLNALVFGCLITASDAGVGPVVDMLLNDNTAYCIECTIYGGDDGFDFNTPLAGDDGSFSQMSNIVYNHDTAFRTAGTASRIHGLFNNAIGGITTADYAGFGDFEDLFSKIPLTADPFTNAAGGDFTLNNTAGGGALCRNVGVIGLLSGGAADETVANAFDLGAFRHGTDDGGDGGTLIAESSCSVGGGLSPRDMGLVPLTKTSELA